MQQTNVEKLQLYFDDPVAFLSGLSSYKATVDFKFQFVNDNRIEIKVQVDGNGDTRLQNPAIGDIFQHLVSLRYRETARNTDQIELVRIPCTCQICLAKKPCVYGSNRLNFNCSSCCEYARKPFCKPLQIVGIKAVPIDDVAKLADVMSGLSVNENSVEELMRCLGGIEIR